LRGLIVEETGQAEDAPLVSMAINCIKQLKKFAVFDAPIEPVVTKVDETPKLPAHIQEQFRPNPENQAVGLRLGYTINLNLPATSDIAVFNAIFKSLKENLLQATNEDQ
jgi:hypothetical protein